MQCLAAFLWRVGAPGRNAMMDAHFDADQPTSVSRYLSHDGRGSAISPCSKASNNSGCLLAFKAYFCTRAEFVRRLTRLLDQYKRSARDHFAGTVPCGTGLVAKAAVALVGTAISSEIGL